MADPEPSPALEALPSPSLATFVQLNLGPLWERFLLGEGALLVVNAALIVALGPPLTDAVGYLALSTFVLSAAYAVNDWKDCEDDRRNPKKNQRLVEGLVQWKQPFLAWLVVLHLGLVLVAWLWLGQRAGLAVGVMLAVNAVYSGWLKGMPIADLLIVGVWGAAYAAIVPASWRAYLFVGAMTAIMHIFQIQQDRDVDAANQVTTTVVRLPGVVHAALLAFCAALAWALLEPLGPVWAATALIPLALRLTIRDTSKAWMACRVYCGVALLALLWSLHGHS